MKAYRHVGDSFIQIVQSDPNNATISKFYLAEEARLEFTGRALVNLTCQDADMERVTLFVVPYAFSSVDPESDTDMNYEPTYTKKQLEKMYRSFGFRYEPKSNNMKRKPR